MIVMYGNYMHLLFILCNKVLYLAPISFHTKLRMH